MAELTPIEEKLAEVLGLAQAAQKTTEKVIKLVEQEGDGDGLAATLQRMHQEAVQTEERCRQVAAEHEGRKTAIEDKARETKREAVDMMQTYLGDDSDALDGFEWMIMAEAGELGHVEVVREINDKVGDQRVRELVDFVLPIQERHFQTAREGALKLAAKEAEES